MTETIRKIGRNDIQLIGRGQRTYEMLTNFGRLLHGQWLVDETIIAEDPRSLSIMNASFRYREGAIALPSSMRVAGRPALLVRANLTTSTHTTAALRLGVVKSDQLNNIHNEDQIYKATVQPPLFEGKDLRVPKYDENFLMEAVTKQLQILAHGRVAEGQTGQ